MDDLKSRIAARLAIRPVLPESSPGQLDQHQLYLSLLTKWNRTINLTSLQLEPLSDEAIDRLLVEPIEASRVVAQAPGADGRGVEIVDLGSGGGSPAVPFWIELPGSRLTMVESRSRKCAFLRESVRQIRAGYGRALDCRFEQLFNLYPDLRQSADLVTVRAVRLDEPTSSLIGDLLKPEGKVVHFGAKLSVFSCSTWNNRDNEPSSS